MGYLKAGYLKAGYLKTKEIPAVKFLRKNQNTIRTGSVSSVLAA